MGLHVYGVAIEMVRQVRPLIERIEKKDASLADQLRRAAASVALNIQEGAHSRGGNVRARFFTAAGSAAEVQACIDVAEALGYVEEVDFALRDKVARVVATLHRLARR
jgi:four helix bundle protein